MTSLEKYYGKEIKNQDHFNGYCSMLLGRSPERMDILAAENSRDFVIFDGKLWREFIRKQLRKDNDS
ncbi:hypothetical protein D3OALGA1CA_2673 [Olavius algarvensis associated proteobacterium Delta 3]|nr:hypothetical protein D3OALGB2SA_2623 [Olavius algarvensis associated proteobacterium Delta 3]CAB5122608.1 hypothetical protein D3OALGA1CA_2673 [Olavius algarvensis associated proteobacterium Delta 3]